MKLAITIEEANSIMENKNGNLDLIGTQIASLPDGLKVSGSLYLNGTPIASLPEGLTVGGNLDLSGTQITSLPDGLKVSGSLYLNGTPIASLPEGLTVGGNLDLYETQITSLPEGLTVGGNLDLYETQITSLPEGLTVGGNLDLYETQITSLPEGLTVGGNLNLSRTPITTLPGSLKFGNDIISKESNITAKDKLSVKRLKNGDYEPNRYIYADGILTHIISKREIKGYTFYKGRIPNRNVVFDGEHYAHCKTFKDGIVDLKFKAAKDRGAEQYSHLTLDSELSPEELIIMYRVITGACKQGTELFVSSLGSLKDKYTIGEAIEITKGQYNSTVFERFFK